MDIAPVFHPTRSKYLVFTLDVVIPLLITLGVICLLYFVFFSSFFKVNSISCTLDYVPCQDPSVIAELDKLKGQNIFRFNSAAISNRLTSGDFTIRKSVFTRQLPGTINVSLDSVYPVVALQVVGDTTWVVMDPSFRVIATRTTDPNVPTVLIASALTVTVGQPPADDLIIKTLSLALRLTSELFTIKSLSLIDADTIELTLESGLKAIFTPNKDESVQLKSLQAVLQDATILQGVRTIDVRFARPVLR